MAFFEKSLRITASFIPLASQKLREKAQLWIPSAEDRSAGLSLSPQPSVCWGEHAPKLSLRVSGQQHLQQQQAFWRLANGNCRLANGNCRPRKTSELVAALEHSSELPALNPLHWKSSFSLA